MRHNGLVTTIKERCRVCYTCVRECPAKAIRIAVGQAEVLSDRCIGCGNCVRVCSQRAKQALDAKGAVQALLAGDGPVAALLAPSFPAEFAEIHWRRMVGMLRGLGFKHVNEVAFGADLVADRYQRLLEESGDGERFIATTCPAMVAYVERYEPDLVGRLAPIVSPMVAAARALRAIHGDGLRMVFIGPCIAKKGEVANENLPDEVDEALTFVELREMLEAAGVTPDKAKDSEFDDPQAGGGAMFSISRGLLQAASLPEDLIDGRVVAADGRTNFVDAIKEFGAGQLNAKLLEVLACHGCIMGPGVSGETPLFARRSAVSSYVREKMVLLDRRQWQADMDMFAGLDLSRTFNAFDQRLPAPIGDAVTAVLERMGKQRPEDELNCGACGYDTCRDHAVAIVKGLAESEMCLPHTIEQLHSTIGELAASNQQLASTREALVQSEKLASMGQLAAGIAHEVNNPLGVVLMYAHLLLEDKSTDPKLRDDLGMIAAQADRCKKIVAGLLNFARQTKVLRQSTDVTELVEQTLRAVGPPENVRVRTEHHLGDRMADLDRDQIVQVLTNLMTNAYAAMPEGGAVTIRTSQDKDDEYVLIRVSDTGVGIPEQNLPKVFEPFFTTKQLGKGTGLGLAVTYGIVKMHSGDVTVRSNADPAAGPTGTTFTVKLPRHAVAGAAAAVVPTRFGP